MIRFLIAICLLLMGSLSAHASILNLPHKTIKLSNGLKLYMVKYPIRNVVAYQLAVHVGSRNEVEPGKSGFAHFFEHLMFRGTKNRTGKEFGELYARLGCENNAWTSNDMTDYHGVVASQYLPRILDAEADRFMNLYFDEKLLRDEAGAVLGEYNKNISRPEFILEEKLMETAFKVHPYSHTTMGYKQDILKYTERYQDVWPFFKKYYRPSNLSIVLVGDIDFKSMETLVKAKFEKWKDLQMSSDPIPSEPDQSEARELTFSIAKPTQTRIAVAYKIPAFSTQTKDIASLTILAEMFFSTTSEFQKTFRYEKKWVDDVAATSGNALLPLENLDPGLWTITLRLTEEGKGKEKELTQAIDSTLASIRNRILSNDRLRATKKRFRNLAIASWFNSPGSLASTIAAYTNFEPDIEVLNRILNQIDSVQISDLKAFSNKYLLDSRKTTVTLRGNST